MKNRKTNIELLRIIAMLLIISFHCVIKGGYIFKELNLNSYIIKIFSFGGEIGVNIFFLISGYFLVNKKSKFNLTKLLKLIIEVEFYNIILLIIGYRINFFSEYTIKDTIIIFLPIIFNRYWFIEVYIILYTLEDYIKKFIIQLNEQEHKKLIIICLILWSVIPTIFGIFVNSSESTMYYSRLTWGLVMYLIGSYINIYRDKFKINIKKLTYFSIITFTILISTIYIFYKFLPFFTEIGTTNITYFWTPNNIFTISLSISIFLIFFNLKIKNNIIVNKIASTTFGIYLLHDGILWSVLWKKVLKSEFYLNSENSVYFILISTIIIFIMGVIFDLLRQEIELLVIKKFKHQQKKSCVQ